MHDDCTPVEEWRPVVGYEGLYEVSNLGQVRRASDATKRNYLTGFMLRPASSARKHPAVRLRCNGIAKTLRVHRLVALAFLGQPPLGLEVNHIDGNKNNNQLENLEYVSRSENAKHAYLIGLNGHQNWAKGERVGGAKLTEDGIRSIRLSDETCAVLARRYDVSVSLISMVRSRKVWKHIT